MPPRLYLPQTLSADSRFELPPAAARHVQVLRLQPGDALTLYDGRGGEWGARVEHMGRREVGVRVEAHHAVERELAVAVTLALGMPANERMDSLVEKATELGVAVLQPLVTERSVLRLSGERAERRRLHWEAIAASASEQSGRTRVPRIEPVQALGPWMAAQARVPIDEVRWLLQPDTAAGPSAHWPAPRMPRLVVLSGPEGGLAPAECAQALGHGFAAVGLGPRVLRADTAPLAALAQVALLAS